MTSSHAVEWLALVLLLTIQQDLRQVELHVRALPRARAHLTVHIGKVNGIELHFLTRMNLKIVELRVDLVLATDGALLAIQLLRDGINLLVLLTVLYIRLRNEHKVRVVNR